MHKPYMLLYTPAKSADIFPTHPPLLSQGKSGVFLNLAPDLWTHMCASMCVNILVWRHRCVD